MAGRLYPESSQMPVEAVPRRDMPDEVPRTWILTLRDRTHPVGEQRASIEALGGVKEVIEMDVTAGQRAGRLAELWSSAACGGSERGRLRVGCRRLGPVQRVEQTSAGRPVLPNSLR